VDTESDVGPKVLAPDQHPGHNNNKNCDSADGADERGQLRGKITLLIT
jgi:hypothetical protein